MSQQVSKKLSKEFVSALSHAVEMQVDQLSVELRVFDDEGATLKAIPAAERAALLSRLNAGEHVEVEFEATTFIQRDTPNRNYVRFKKAMLSKFAKSFTGQPFLANHNSWDIGARGGTILESKGEQTDEGFAIRMRIRAVKAWAVAGVLDGTIDRFSIGWHRTAPMECSVHGGRIGRCDCWPGSEVADGDKVVRAEWVVTGADGTEVSGVNVPAVVGTGIDAVKGLAQMLDLSELTSMLDIEHTEEEPRPMSDFTQVRAALGLAATATEAEVLAAIAKATKDKETAEATLAVANARAAEEAAAAAASAVDVRINGLYTAGKLRAKFDAAGKRIPGDVENALRGLAKQSFDVFEAQCKELEKMPSVTLVGAGLQSTTPPAPGTITAGGGTNPYLASYLKAAGITEKQFEQYGQRHLAAVEANGR